MFDIAINNGVIVDGTGEKAYNASIGIKDDSIVEINKNNEQLMGKTMIDAEGLVVAPGFIDIHSHSDSTFLLDNRSESKVFQGVTTEVIGNCGDSLVPNKRKTFNEFKAYADGAYVGAKDIDWAFNSLEEYVKELERVKMSINCLPMIGHGALRTAVMGFDNRAPSKKEMKEMKELLSRELRFGAWGMSAGLIYPPGCFSNIEELIELGKVLADYDAIFTAHIRGESDTVFDAVKEMIEIGKKTGVHIHISHLKLMGKNQWGKADELLFIINEYLNQGGNISCDQYPYTASMTSLSTLVPEWAHEGGVQKMLENLNGINEDNVLEGIDREMDKRGGSDKIVIMYSGGAIPDWEGKSIKQISDIIDLEPSKTVRKILEMTSGKIKAIFHTMNEEDVKAIIKDLNVSVGSDGYGIDYAGKIYRNKIHPRSFGTFPRFIRFSRENNLLSLEDIVYKMTGLAAKHIGLKNRGNIKINSKADIVILNYKKVTDTATYINPFSKPEGIFHVIVGGKPVIYNGNQTQERPGRVILKSHRC